MKRRGWWLAHLVRDETGQAAPLVAVMLVGVVAITGLVIDGGLLFAARRDLQGMADGAARSGAMAVDEEYLRSSGGEVRLDESAALARVSDYLATERFSGHSEVEIGENDVRVRLRVERPTLVMGIAGLRSVPMDASSTAVVRRGISGPEL
jgi:hypothetical protein